jgi:hypothetical protein
MTPATGFADDKYICTVKEVQECVAVTGCSRLSLADANLAGIMELDVEKKQMKSVSMGGEPRTDDVDVTVTEKTILLRGARDDERIWSAVISRETGNVTAGIATLDSTLALSGYCAPKP